MNKLLQVSALIGGVSLAGVSHAQSVDNVSITGPYDVWNLGGGGVLTNIGQAPPPLEPFLLGSAAAPGSNIELANDDPNWAAPTNASTTLSGTLDGLTVEIRSANQGDWQANAYALAFAYVNGALASIGKTSADWNVGLCGSFDGAVDAFVNGPPGPPTGAQRASDPNVGYIALNGNQVLVGLQGQLNAITAGIGPLLACVGYNPAIDPFPPQASEVMALKISRGGETLYDDFAYSFTATPTGQATSGGSYDGNYEITVPVPAPPPVSVPAVSALGLAGSAAGLLAIGLAGLRRRRSG